MGLVPRVSWQYLDGGVFPDAGNFLLRRGLLIDRIPRHSGCDVVSLLTGGGGDCNDYPLVV